MVQQYILLNRAMLNEIFSNRPFKFFPKKIFQMEIAISVLYYARYLKYVELKCKWTCNFFQILYS